MCIRDRSNTGAARWKKKAHILVAQPIVVEPVSTPKLESLLGFVVIGPRLLENCYDYQGVVVLVWLLLPRYDSSPHEYSRSTTE